MIVEGIDHINIPVTNLSKSTSFYSELFDFDIEEESSSHAILDLDPMRIKLIQVDKVSPGSLPVISFILDVDDFTEAIEEIEEKGIKIFKGPETIGKGEYLIFSDPDNHLIEIFYQ